MTRKSKTTTGIPSSEIDSLARALLPTIQELFEQVEMKKEFEAWQEERKNSYINKLRIIKKYLLIRLCN